MPYCMYLRKSRADAEAEARGEGETLARHRTALLHLAKQKQLAITKEYAEVLSGESITSRPVVQQLLADVEQGLWDGVIVMEVERLARGDTIDQGIVAQAFKYSNTKIVTPTKTYDPNNEFDEEYFEFGLFMSRREYKTIKRRLERGRIASVNEGKYIGSVPPYGYTRVKLSGEKGYTLEPHPVQREVICSIFRWFVEDGIGTPTIANLLNDSGFKTAGGKEWLRSTVVSIIKNPVYAGNVKWGSRAQVKSSEGGRVSISSPVAKEYLITNGLHEALVPAELFDLAQKKLSERHMAPVPKSSHVQNPLAGLLVCGICGHNMVRMQNRKRETPAVVLCSTRYCLTVSSELSLVEEAVLHSLRLWLSEYEIEIFKTSKTKSILSDGGALLYQKSELEKLRAQLTRSYELVEQGVYSTDVFMERSHAISDQIVEASGIISRLESDAADHIRREQAKLDIIPQVRHVIEVYPLCESPKEKNDLLKSVLEKVIYTKTKPLRWTSREGDELSLTLFPRIPK